MKQSSNLSALNLSQKSILGLELPTDPRWANIAEKNLEEILTDHAFCEQKAASTCISLIQKYSEHTAIVDALSPIVAEEWGHFRQVLKEMKKRGYQLGKQRPDEYVNALLKRKFPGANYNQLLANRLLLCALIEARSCERFRLLAKELDDIRLRDFYYQFMISEAGNYRTFIDLAKEFLPEDEVNALWKEWLSFEADILQNMEVRADRMH